MISDFSAIMNEDGHSMIPFAVAGRTGCIQNEVMAMTPSAYSRIAASASPPTCMNKPVPLVTVTRAGAGNSDVIGKAV